MTMNTASTTSIAAEFILNNNSSENLASTEESPETKIISVNDLKASQLTHRTTSDYIGCFVSWSIHENTLVTHENLKLAFEQCDVNSRLLPSQKTPEQAFSTAISKWNSSASANKPNGWRLGMIPQKDVPQYMREKGYKMAALTSSSNVKDDVLVVKLGKAQALTLSFLCDRDTEKIYFNVEGRKDEDWGKRGELICAELEQLYDECFLHDRHAIHGIVNRFVSRRGLTVNNQGSSSSLIFVPGKWLKECESMKQMIDLISRYDANGFPYSNLTLIPQYTLTDLGAIKRQIEDQITEEIHSLIEEAKEFNSSIPELKNNNGQFTASVEKKISDFGDRRNRLAGYAAKFTAIQSDIDKLDVVLDEIAASYDVLVQIISLNAAKQGMTVNRKVASARSRLFSDV